MNMEIVDLGPYVGDVGNHADVYGWHEGRLN
jgi:hypothetical protein